MPPMCAADNRRVPGWRLLREYLTPADGAPVLRISSVCAELIRSMPALLCDTMRPEDASNEPHAVTHAPEALRYAVMSRAKESIPQERPDNTFRFAKKERSLF
jgi:phage terminase large subunit